MNILIFSQYYYPEQFLINEIAERLVTEGNRVTVVTGLPNYPSGVIDSAYRHGKKRDEMINGVHVVRCSIVARGHNKIKLLCNYFSYMLKAAGRAEKLKEEFDVVYSYQLTPILQTSPAIKYCRRHKLKLFMYNCDLAPMSGSKIIKKAGLLVKLYTSISRKIMNSCDLIGVTSKSFIEYNHTINGVPYEKMVYLPQHASGKLLNVDLKAEENGYVDFMFAGNIGKGASLDTIVDAIKILNQEVREKVKIHIVGDGSYLSELKELVAENDLGQVFIFHGRYPMDAMPEMYKKADALLITLRKGQITVPGKLQTYMTTGKPILGAMDGSGKELIEEAACGICVPAEDSKQLSQAITDYVEHIEAYEGCGQKGSLYAAKYFSLDAHMYGLKQNLQLLVNNHQK